MNDEQQHQQQQQQQLKQQQQQKAATTTEAATTTTTAAAATTTTTAAAIREQKDHLQYFAFLTKIVQNVRSRMKNELCCFHYKFDITGIFLPKFDALLELLFH